MIYDVARLTDGRVEKVRRVYEQHGQTWPKQHEGSLRKHMLSYEHGAFRTMAALEWFIDYVRNKQSYSPSIQACVFQGSVTGRFAVSYPQVQEFPKSTTTKGNTMKVTFSQAGRVLGNQASAAHHIQMYSTPVTIRVDGDNGNVSERMIQTYDLLTYQRASDIVAAAVAELQAEHLKQFPAKYTNQAAKNEAVRVAHVKLEHARREVARAEVGITKARSDFQLAEVALRSCNAMTVAFDGPDFLIERNFQDPVPGRWKVVHQPSGHVTTGLPTYKDAETLIQQRKNNGTHPANFNNKYKSTEPSGGVRTTNA